MAVSESPARAAAAFQVVASLEAYEAALRRLMETPDDIDSYRSANEHADRVRLHSASTPDLAVARITLLLAHVELIHTLWMRSAGKAAATAVDTCMAEARRAIDELRQETLRIFVPR